MSSELQRTAVQHHQRFVLEKIFSGSESGSGDGKEEVLGQPTPGLELPSCELSGALLHVILFSEVFLKCLRSFGERERQLPEHWCCVK